MSAMPPRHGAEQASPVDDSTRQCFERIWETAGRGDPRITVAMLDGPVDLTHESLRRANIRVVGQGPRRQGTGVAERHGTAVASIIFGTGAPRGLAPGCTGLSIELFDAVDAPFNARPTCSQADLAAAIDTAVDAGAHLINISAGEIARDADVDPALLAAIEKASGSHVLIVAATGDGGCCDRRVPSSLVPVVAVSDLAHHLAGVACSTEGCVNGPGTNIIVAEPGGGLATASGSSYATAIVSALAALLLSEQLRSLGRTDAAIVRQSISAGPFSSEVLGALDIEAVWHRFLDASAVARREIGAKSSVFPYPITNWALRTKFGGVDREKFGSVDVLLPTGTTRNQADLRYPVGAEPTTMRIVPASDEPVVNFPDGTRGTGHSRFDGFLRQEMGISENDPIYALLSYIHPEEHQASAAALPQTAKMYLGHRHIGAYLGIGRTTHALSAPSRWRGSGPADMAMNFDYHPANVQVIGLQGVPQATLNRNARLIDLLVSAKAKVPVSTDVIDCRTVDLTTTLQYYRDLILDEAYLEDVSWFTNCSVHKTIVVNLALNLPHNERAMRELFGAADAAALWDAITTNFSEILGRSFEPDDETDFTPLWKIEGIPASRVRPLSLREYNRYQAAVTEHRQGTFVGRRPLSPNEGLAWPLETLLDILCAFVDTYTPLIDTGGLVAASQAILLRHVVRQRLGIDDTRFLEAAEPLVARLLAAESLRVAWRAADDADDWWEKAAAQLAKWTIDGDQLYEPANDAFVPAYIEKVLKHANDIVSSLPQPLPRNDDEVASWYENSVGPALHAAQRAFVTNGGTHGLCSSPAIFHKLGRGTHPMNEHVSVRTVCTVMDVSHLIPASSKGEVPTVITDPPSDEALNGATADDAYSAHGGMFSKNAIAPSTSSPSVERASPQLANVGALSPYRDNSGIGIAATLGEPVVGQLVYALGRVTYDFPTRARRESMRQLMGDDVNPDDTVSMVAHLNSHPSDAVTLQWILELEGVPLYFLYPTGPFAQDTFETLRTFLREQLEEGVERVSIPGTIVGTAPHRMGIDLPVVTPELRGMFSWTTDALISSLVSPDIDAGAEKDATEQNREDVRAGVAAFLDRVYFDLRNRGVGDRERALNYAATNAFSIERVYEQAIRENMELDTIDVEASSVGIPGMNMWDVKLSFFFPDRPPQSPRRMYRFTVSVEDVIPITIGPVRSWMVR